jgi:C1A family cysteine protease
MNTMLSHPAGYGKGWCPDAPDFRDHQLSNILPGVQHVPASMNLRLSPHMPPIQDQGQLGSCTAFGTLRCFDFAQHMETGQFFNGSHLFQYYNTRSLEGTTNQDAGGSIRDAMKALAHYGVCPELEWPYNPVRFRRDPAPNCYQDALHHRSIQYLRVARTGIRQAIAAGFPVVFGATLYESFESIGPTIANHWTIPMPDKSESIIGGHCLTIAGYDDNARAALCANSWGLGWGNEGYFWMPYPYFANAGLTSDFWTLRKTQI